MLQFRIYDNIVGCEMKRLFCISWIVITFLIPAGTWGQCPGTPSFSPSVLPPVCSGSLITVSNASGPGNYTVFWRLNGAITASGNTFSRRLSGNNVLFLVRVFQSGCRDSVSVPVNLLPKPRAALTSPAFFRNCTSDTSITINPFLLQVNNTTNSNGTNPTAYVLDWGDGSPVENFGPAFANASHNYAGTLGLSNLRLIVQSDNGCADTLVQEVFNGRPAKIALPSGGTNIDLCIRDNGGVLFPINLTNFQNNPPGTIYIVESNDPNSVKDTFLHPPPNPINFRFLTSSCGFTSASTPNSFSVTITARNACPLPQSNTRAPIIVREKPKLNVQVNPTGVKCLNTNISFTASNSGQDIQLSPVTGLPECTSDIFNGLWTISPGTYTITGGSLNSSNLTVQFLNPGNYQVKFFAENSCDKDTFIQDVCIKPPPDASFQFAASGSCSPLMLNLTNNSPSLSNVFCNPSSYLWTVNQVSGQCRQTSPSFLFTSGNSGTVNADLELRNAGVYQIVLSENNGCGTDTAMRNITVKGKPQVKLSPLSGGCGIVTINPAIQQIESCGGTNAGPTWSFPGGNPQTASGAAPGNVVYNNPGTFAVRLAESNECGTGSDSVQISVVADLVADAGPDDTLCMGESLSLGSDGKPGIFYKWMPPEFLSSTNTAKPVFTPGNVIGPSLFRFIRTDSLSAGCISRDTVEIFVIPQPIPPLVAPDTICPGTDIRLTAIPLEPNHEISWYGDPGFNILAGTGSTLDLTNVLTESRYYLQVKDTNGCIGKAIEPVLVSVFETIDPQALNDEICTDTAFYPLNKLIEPYKARWTGQGVVNDSLYLPATTGLKNFSFSFTDSNQCIVSGNSSILVKPIINPNAGPPLGLCKGDQPVNLSGNPAGGIWFQNGVTLDSTVFSSTNTGDYEMVYQYGEKNCLRRDTVFYTVFELPKLINGGPYAVCSNVASQLLTPQPPGGNWTDNRINGNLLDPGLFGAGNYTISYAFTDSNGCRSVSETALNILKAPEAAFSIRDTNCILEETALRNESTGAVLYRWNYGNGETFELDELYHTYIYDSSGVYTINMIAIADNACIDTAQQNTFIAPRPVPLVSPADTSVCGPVRILFRNLSNVPGGVYSWTFGNGENYIGFERPDSVLFPGYPDQPFTYDGVLKVSTRYCSDQFSNFRVQTIAPPKAQIGINGPLDGCTPFTSTLLNNSLGNPTSALLYQNDSLLTQNFDSLTKDYTADDSIRTYKMRLVVSTTGCPTSSDSLVIRVLPNTLKASFTYLQGNGNCAPSRIEFNNTSTPADLYQWDFGLPGATYTGRDTGWFYPQGGVYTVRLFIYRNCPNLTQPLADTSIQQITIAPQPVADFLPIAKNCSSYQVECRNLSTGNFSSVWDFGDGSGSNEASPVYFYDSPGKYVIRLKVTAEQTGCTDTLELPITLYPEPLALFDTTRAFICAGDSLLFINESLNNDQSVWFWGDGKFETAFSDTVFHTWNVAGQYDVKLIVYNSTSQCYDTLSSSGKTEVRAPPPGGFSLNPEVAEYKTCFVDLIPSPDLNPFTQAEYFLYDENDSLMFSFQGTTSDINCGDYPEGVYTVEQVITGDFGCKTITRNQFIIREVVRLFLPNAFIPESENEGDSRIFRAYGTGISKFNLRIFDRWGIQLFESNQLEEAWNGKLNNNGALQPTGLYAVRIVYTGVDGITQTKNASVMLIR
jgi:hypothetical protein